MTFLLILFPQKFQGDLRDHQECVDKIKMLAEEILLNCHPNAIRFVKYYLTITQTRWDQVKNLILHILMVDNYNENHFQNSVIEEIVEM